MHGCRECWSCMDDVHIVHTARGEKKSKKITFFEKFLK